jgi:methanogenic corrinoid protein MtbC1
VGIRGLTSEDRDRYLHLVGAGRVDEAVELCLDLLDAGVSPQDITLRILRPVQREVGRRWALGRWSVAQEHAATAVTDAALGALGTAAPGRPQGEPVLVACPEGEWHCLASRMVAQLLRWRGVAADHVGTVASAAALDHLLDERRPRALALSCSTMAVLPGVARAVEIAARWGTPTLAGGSGFGAHGRYARAVGITAWDHHVTDAVRRLDRWEAAGAPRPGPPPPETIAYRHLLRRRPDLVEEIAERLRPGLDDIHRGSGAEIAHDSADQVASLALAAARTRHTDILSGGLTAIIAALVEQADPAPAIAARLPEAARAALGHSVVDARGGGRAAWASRR